MKQGFKETLKDAGKILLLSTALGLTHNVLSPDGIPLIRSPRQLTWATDTTTSNHAVSPEPIAITVDEAEGLFHEGNAIFLDARNDEEYRLGHIKGARSLPLELLGQKPELVASIPKDALIVTYCSGVECELSIDLGLKLASLGYTNVRIFFAGWLEWQKRNLPIETGSSPGL